MTTKNLTIKKFAALIGEDYLTGSALTKFLVKTGIVTDTGTKEPAEGGRGKPSVIYAYPNDTALVFWDEIESDQAAEALQKQLGNDNVAVAAPEPTVVPAVAPEPTISETAPAVA